MGREGSIQWLDVRTAPHSAIGVQRSGDSLKTVCTILKTLFCNHGDERAMSCYTEHVLLSVVYLVFHIIYLLYIIITPKYCFCNL